MLDSVLYHWNYDSFWFHYLSVPQRNIFVSFMLSCGGNFFFLVKETDKVCFISSSMISSRLITIICPIHLKSDKNDSFSGRNCEENHVTRDNESEWIVRDSTTRITLFINENFCSNLSKIKMHTLLCFITSFFKFDCKYLL